MEGTNPIAIPHLGAGDLSNQPSRTIPHLFDIFAFFFDICFLNTPNLSYGPSISPWRDGAIRAIRRSPSQKPKIRFCFLFGLYTFLQHPKISSTTHFHYELVSPSTVLRNLWTHPKFCATPWYIESLSSDICSIVWLTSYGDFRRETIQNTQFQGWALWGYIIRTIYFQDNVFSENILFEDPYLEITRFYEKIKVVRRP